MTRITTALAATFLALAPLSAAAGDAPDPRLGTNPALMAMYERDPTAAAGVMADLDAVLQGPKVERPRTLDEDEETIQLLSENPLLKDAYRRDPKATAKLIDVIRPAREE